MKKFKKTNDFSQEVIKKKYTGINFLKAVLYNFTSHLTLHI